MLLAIGNWRPKTMNTNHDLESIFSQAIELADPIRRDDYLDRACAGDAKLHNRISSLLEASRRASSFMEEAVAEIDLDALQSLESSPIGEQPGDVVGRYTLQQQLGEGGMGTVFLAEQAEPVQRQVAIKIVKPGLDTKEVIARFESERQALAMMDHPNIARVLDAGATERGRPYFVMELVHGVPITDYCNEARLTTRQRLELFIQVCHAIQHSHQKGVIHRDIKPSNVLVTVVDGKPVPKVIDFGIAKAVDHRLTESTLFTRYGEFIGTPAYMSPEQATLSEIDIDTRSDVYSLGAMLYELLTGQPLFDSEQIKQLGTDEIRRFVQEVTPRPPSHSVLTDGGQQAITVASARNVTPSGLKSQISGELDWIVMRALEKERARRYETTLALADDLQRYLDNEPVVARPQTSAYRLQKFVLRNRVAVTASLAILATMALATMVSGTLAIRALQSNRQATLEAESLNEVVSFINNGLFGQANPIQEPNRNIRLRTVLDRAAQKLSVQPIERPEVEMAVRSTIGDTYRSLGESAAAMPHLERAHALAIETYGARHNKSIAASNDVAAALLGMGKFREATQLLEESHSVAEQRLAKDDELLLSTMALLAKSRIAAGEVDAAESMLREVLNRRDNSDGPDAPETLAAQGDLGTFYATQGRWNDALELLTHAYEGLTAANGKWHPATMKTALNLAALQISLGNLTTAAEVYEETLTLATSVLGGDHPQTLTAMHGLALVRYAQQRTAEADELFTAVFNGQVAELGKQHPATLDTLHNLAKLRTAQGRIDEAESMLMDELQHREAVQGKHHPATQKTLESVAFFYLNQSRFADAVRYYDRVADRLQRVNSQDMNAYIARTMSSLCRLKLGEYQRAGEDLESVRQFCEESQPDHWLLFVAESLRGEVLLRMDRRNDAEDALVRGYEGLKIHETDLPGHWKPMGLSAATRRLAEFYESAATPELRMRAEAYRTELQQLRTNMAGSHQGTTGNLPDGNPN